LIESKKIKAVVDYGECLYEKVVWLDIHRTKQVIFNLISNSVKFTENGSISLKLSTHKTPSVLANPSEEFNDTSNQNPEIASGKDALDYSVTDPRDDEITGISQKYLRIEITDSGPGINAIQMKKIFTRPDKKHVGTHHSDRLRLGMGLWVTKNIVEAMGGSINIYSCFGRGT